MKKKSILLDPGHGGPDSGAVYAGAKEAALNLAIAEHIGDILRATGHNVFYTRVDDSGLSLTDRLRLEAALDPACTISIHCNAAQNPEAQGFEVAYWYKSARSLKLAQLVNDRMKALPLRERPLYQADDNPGTWWRDLAMLHKTKGPAVLVECGFGSNGADLEYLKSKEGQAAIANAIAAAIINFTQTGG